MFIKDHNFEVIFSNYSQRHYCKDFIKKYKPRQWIETKKTIIAVLERAHSFQERNLIDLLSFNQEVERGIFKLDFRVAGTKESPKTSGNRVIFNLCNLTAKIEILIVYNKNNCDKKQSETQWIFNQIKENFPEYKKYLK